MRNLFLFYMVTMLPLALLSYLSKTGNMTSVAFVSLLGFYALIYHPLMAGVRLVSMNKIKTSEIWYNLIPFWNSKYFTTLFFTRG